jgi:negative regulator of flagellin synthesis FlgM
MKIAGQGASHVIDIYHGDPPAAQQQSGDPSKGHRADTIEISPQARELDRLKKTLDALPEVRMERVALMKQEMGHGNYRIEAEAIATRIMEIHSWRSKT